MRGKRTGLRQIQPQQKNELTHFDPMSKQTHEQTIMSRDCLYTQITTTKKSFPCALCI